MKQYDERQGDSLILQTEAVSARFGGWMLGVVLISIFAFLLLSVYAATAHGFFYSKQLESIYQRSFYDLHENMSNLEVKLSKLMVTGGMGDTEDYLNEITRQTDLTALSLSELPTTENTLTKTEKFINQVGDYCSYLSHKIAYGEPFTEEEYKKIESLYQTNHLLLTEITVMAQKVNAGYSFTENMDRNQGYNSYLYSSFDEIENGSVEYPTMIYDGPFSDNLASKEPLGLTKQEISLEAALKFIETHEVLKLSEVRHIGDSNGHLYTYNFSGKTKSGSEALVQVSKRGGKVLLYDAMRTPDHADLSDKECIRIAEDFAKNMGILQLSGLWVSNYGGYAYVNLAYTQNDIIYYPDLVKIIVAKDTGEVLGMEAATYYSNHTERSGLSPTLTTVQARQKVFSKLKIESERLALIPYRANTERLCYEFYGTYSGLKYFVYIDAKTGEELDVLRVVDSDKGSLVL